MRGLNRLAKFMVSLGKPAMDRQLQQWVDDFIELEQTDREASKTLYKRERDYYKNIFGKESPAITALHRRRKQEREKIEREKERMWETREKESERRKKK